VAWTTFPTLIDGQIWTGAHTQLIRDNFAETAPAKATTPGSHFAGTGTNSIAERIPATATNLGAGSVGSTTSTSYIQALTGTTCPALTITTGVKALVSFSTRQTAATAGQNVWTSIAVTGASSITTNLDNWAASWDGTGQHYYGVTYLETGLTAGSNIFTMQCRVSSGTGTFSTQRVSVVPF
jgi:hypothetical protein